MPSDSEVDVPARSNVKLSLLCLRHHAYMAPAPRRDYDETFIPASIRSM